MAQQSLKNLDSFSRGYIEDVRSNIDFDTTLRAFTRVQVTNGTTIALEYIPVAVLDGSPYVNEIDNPILGKVISGKGIVGTPRVTSISGDRLTITFDQPQTFDDVDGIILTFSDTNSGIDQYELTGSAKSRSKEDLRIEQLVPEELLDYATNSAYGNNGSGGIRAFMESYYKFMNLEEFTYKDEETFEDIVIDNQAIFRIDVPNKFFQRNLILSAKFFDSDGKALLVGDEDGTPRVVGDPINLDDTALLVVGSSYQIVDLGNGVASNIVAGINNISGQENIEYFINDIFVATNNGTSYDATLGSVRATVRLLEYPSVVDDIFKSNISISNANKLPGRLADSAEPTGRTVNIYGLSPRLNKRKIVMKTFVYNHMNAGPSYRLNTIEDSLNLNEAQEQFLDLMQKEIAPSLDKTSPVNKRAVYQKIIDFYKIRGSFESIETFFKLLYNEQEIQVSFPWDKTLKPSDGRYDPKSAVQSNYSQKQIIQASDNANDDLFGRSVSISGDSFAASSPKQEAAIVDILTDAAANAGSNNKTIPLANTTGLQIGMVVTSVTDASNITADSKIESIIDGVSINLDTNIAENIGSGDTIKFTGQANAGAVYVYTTTDSGTTFTEEQKIVSTFTDADTNFVDDNFGQCVALDGNTLAVSAPGDETTLGVANTGSVEIWNRGTDTSGNNIWRFNSKLIPPTSGERFAHGRRSVSLSGDYLAVGHVGFDADEANEPHGAVIIYKKVGSTWQILQTIRAPAELHSPTIDANKGFGGTITIKGKYLVVSFENYSNVSVVRSGRAIIYKKSNVTDLYELDAILAPTQDISNQYFSSATDITNIENGTPRVAITSRDNPYHTVYVFERTTDIDDNITWHPINSLPSVVTPTERDNTNYGATVKISGDNLLIGEPGFDSDTLDNGKIYHYEFDNDTEVWSQKLQYRGDTSVTNHNFGYSLDISDVEDRNYMVVGAPGKTDGSGSQLGYVRTYNRPALSGSYLTNSGFLSEKSIRVHDSDFYQKFSYVVKVGRNLSQWKEPFDKLVHPAGHKYFGEVLMIIQAVRAVLGDDNPNTTVGVGDDTLTYLNSYAASPAFRKTLSSMPGVQPGYIGIEDVGLLIQAIASSFGIIGVARPNRDAKITMKSTTDNGGLIQLSVAETGHGYPSVPAITLSGNGSGASATAVLDSKGSVSKVIISGSHNTFNIGGIAADDSRTAGTYSNVTTGGSRSSGSGASGTVNIVVTDGGTAATNGVIASIALGNAGGSNYEVGEIITIPDSALGGGGGAAISFTVASVGSGYQLGSTLTAIETLAKENADDSLTGDNEIVASKIGKLNSTTLGLDLVGLNKKDYTSTPTILISAPDALRADGKPLSTNVQATATLTRNSTTKRITGFTITNPGYGYLNDATITVSDQQEKRAPDYIHKKIIPSNHDIEIRAVLPENNYFARKDAVAKENPSFLGPKKFQGNYKINMFDNILIEDINDITADGTAINKLNIQSNISNAIKETTL